MPAGRLAHPNAHIEGCERDAGHRGDALDRDVLQLGAGLIRDEVEEDPHAVSFRQTVN